MEIQGAGHCIRPLGCGLDFLVDSYLAVPQLFLRQFGRPIEQRDHVLAGLQRAQRQGLCSFFEVVRRGCDAPESIGHIRVDWHPEEEASLALHGGSAYPLRKDAGSRLVSWQLAIQAAFKDSQIRQVSSVTAVENKAAQVILATAGFRRVRLMQQDSGRRIAHYLLIRPWARPPDDLADWDGPALTAFRPPTTREIPEDLVAPWPTPCGWARLDSASEADWIRGLEGRLPWLAQLADFSAAQGVELKAVVQSLRFAARHGTAYFGCRVGGVPAALISAQAFPERSGWLRLRGGLLDAMSGAPEISPWLRLMANSGMLKRAEVICPASDQISMNWWLGQGFLREGATALDEAGRELTVSLAWHGNSAD